MKIDLTKTNGSSPPIQKLTQDLTVAASEREEIWTVSEAADYLKMSPRQVLELTRRRTQERSECPVPYFKIHSKCIRFRKRDVQQWLVTLAQKARVQ